MLTQAKVDELLLLVKVLEKFGPIQFPPPGASQCLGLKSADGREEFAVDVNRRSRIKVTKCSYLERYQTTEILLRLDIDGPPHTNPDGVEVPCPHLHVYREGFADKWAHPASPTDFENTSDLVKTLIDFLGCCNVEDIPDVRGGLFDGH
jgi:hypothetical protein